MSETNETEGNAALVVRDLRKEYPTPAEPLVILDGVNLEMSTGESMAVMGPSGSGKSTLLQILGALDHPTSGSVTLGGEEPFAMDPKARARFRNRRIGFVFQDHHLLPQCSVLENVLVPTLVRHDAQGEAPERRACELLEKVGLSGRLTHRPAQLSGGERQRVAVARAMINSPDLLLCDEPTGNLDRSSAAAVGELFAGLNSESGAMLIVVTHDPEFAARFGRQVRLGDGRLEEVSATTAAAAREGGAR